MIDALRGLQLVASMSLAGALVFHLLVAPVALHRILRPSLVLAWGAGLVWLGLQASAFGGIADTLVPLALQTRFGHVLLLRLGLLILAVLLARRAPKTAACLALAGVVLHAAAGHAAAADDVLLSLAVTLHLLAATLWLGGLLPLWLTLESPVALRRFSRLAFPAVIVIAATALVQTMAFAGGVPGLVGTGYGRMLLVKLGLFVLAMGCAATNRVHLLPRLPGALGWLRASLLVEIAAAWALVLVASALAGLPPGIHEQPVWPFAHRLSLIALEDPELRREVADAAQALAGAAALVALGILARRVRWLALAAAVGITVFAVPHFDLLVVPAQPTEFYVSPTGFTAESVQRGAALYDPHCAGCHEAHVKTLDVAPADLTAEHLWDHSDGELFGWLAEGMRGPRGGLAMPGFAAVLEPDALWSLIDFVRARNAGLAFRDAAFWPRPLQAPDFTARCEDGREHALRDFRGEAVQIADENGRLALAAGLAHCATGDAAVLRAYGIVVGGEPGGMWFVIDAAGWLRDAGPASDPPAKIARAIAATATPLPAPDPNHHH